MAAAKLLALAFALLAFVGAIAVALAPDKLAHSLACRSDPEGELLVSVPQPPAAGSPVKAFVALKSHAACFASVEALALTFSLLRDGALVAEDAARAPLEEGTTIPPFSAKDPTGALYRAGVPTESGPYVLFVENADPAWRGATRIEVR